MTVASAAPQAASPQAAPQATPANADDLRSRLLAALTEGKFMNLADALEHSQMSESPNELVFTAPKMYQLFLKEPEFEAQAKRAAGRAVRVVIKVGDPAAPVSELKSRPVPQPAGEAAMRALEHPEVKRFQEMFPDAQVRTVRNLKDN
jgi:hypothetical protein